MQLELCRAWENSLEGVSKEMEGKERRVGREGMRERETWREKGKRDRFTQRHLKIVEGKKCRGAAAEGGQARWKGRFHRLVGEKKGGTARASEL